MALLEKYIILTIIFTLSSAKSYYYDYPHPRRSFNFNWSLRYPQPLISLDGVFPIAPPGPYPYAPSSNNDYQYQYETPSYQQDILVQSLNKALTKLNLLLPPNSNSNKQETTPFPPNTQPEVLAEALNKAIDRLGVILANQEMIQQVADKEKEQINFTIQPDKMYDNVNSAIDDLNKLFSTLPEELKPKPSQNNNNNMKPIIMQTQQLLPPPFVSTIVSQTPTVPLFTSDVLETKVPEPTTPSVPTIVSNSGITESSNDNNLFTSFIPTDNPSSSTITNNVDNNQVQISDGTTVTDSDGETTTYVPIIDIRFKEKNETRTGKQDIIFPDDDDDFDLASRFKPNHTTTITTQNPQFVLTSKPSNLQINQKPIQNKPNVDIGDRFQQTTQNPQLILTYKPSRPPFHPDIFPPNPTIKPQTDSNLQINQKPNENKPNVDLGDRFQQTTQNPQLILTYKPSRPPFHPDIYPPNPTIKPETDSNLQINQKPNENKPNVNIDDKFQQTTTTTTQNPQLILTYKPSRPPFHPDIFPPNPTIKPETDSNLQNQNIDLSDRLKPITTTEKIVTTTNNNNNVPYNPTPYYSTPISLEYKPSRPFYAPNPIVYPRPGKIPPGTPWPASSTERVN